jgi:predicted MFS family arabinose efflux permease
MFTAMAYSIIAPLFPGIAARHGVNEEILGFLMSILALASFSSTPFVPKLINKFGRLEILYFATFGEATCVIIYGFFNLISSFKLFLIVGFTVRIIHGVFTGIVGVLVYSLATCISSEDEIQMALGNMEVAWCIGLSAGPLFASIFYKIGGFTLPFLALGCLLYISVYLTKIISAENINNEENNDNKEETSYFKSVFHLNIILNILAVTFGIIATTFYFPCLTNHLVNKYHLSISISSLFFIVGMVFYMFFLRYLTEITDKLGMEKTPCLGLLMITLGCLFIYPVFPIPQNIISILIGLCLIGGAGAPLNVPGLINMSNYLKFYDNTLDELTSNDIASTLYSLANNIGDFIGPTLGGFLSTEFGFKNCCIILSLLFGIYLVYYSWYFCSSKDLSDIKEKNINEIRDEINISFSVHTNDNLNKTFFGVNNIFMNHSFHMAKKFLVVKRKSNNKLNHTLISSLTY